MDIVCDKCGSSFTLTNHGFRKRLVKDNILVYYFECPHCKDVYITQCIDHYVRSQQQIYSKIRNKERRVSHLKKLNTYSDNLKKEVKWW